MVTLQPIGEPAQPLTDSTESNLQEVSSSWFRLSTDLVGQHDTAINLQGSESAWNYVFDTRSTGSFALQRWQSFTGYLQSTLANQSERLSQFDVVLLDVNPNYYVYSNVFRILEFALYYHYLIGLKTISHDPLDIDGQLQGLKDLQDGWADGMQSAETWGTGYGKAPSLDELDWLAGQFSECYPADLTKPYIYPTPEGGVQAEWSLATNEISLEVDLKTHSAEWHCLNLDTGHCHERVLDLNTKDAWHWLANEVRTFSIAA